MTPTVYDCDDWRALLRTIREQPESDLPRLVAADWLEERGRTYHADFVRLQCELDGIEAKRPKAVPMTPENEAFWEYREELRGRVRTAWRNLDPWEFAAPDWTLTTFAAGTEFRIGPFEGSPADIRCAVKRGFVSEVRLTTNLFAGDPCKACRGSGLRGMEDIHGDRWSSDCGECGRTGFVGGLAGELFRVHPITRVVLTDAVAYPSGGTDTYYVGGLGRWRKEDWRGLDRHRTRQSALEALYTIAAPNWGRFKADSDTP